MGLSYSHCEMTLSYGMVLDFVDKIQSYFKDADADDIISSFYNECMTVEDLKQMIPLFKQSIPTWEETDDYDGYLKSFGLHFIECAEKAIKNNESITVT